MGSTPEPKEPKKMDRLGKNLYSMGGLQLRMTNQQVLLDCHNNNIWEAMNKYRDRLPQASEQEYATLVDEGKTVVRASLRRP